MSLDIGAAITEGVRRLRSRDGLVLIGAFIVLTALFVVALQSLYVELVNLALEFAQSPDAPPGTDVETIREQADVVRANSPAAIDISAGIAFGLLFLAAILTETLRIVAIRVFYAPTDSRSDDLASGLAFATVNAFLGSIVVSVFIILGSLVLVVPGVFLAVMFLFLRQEIAIEDRNFVDAMVESWSLTKGSRWTMFGLFAILVVTILIERFLRFAAGIFDPIAPVVIQVLISPVVVVFGIAATTRAYAQLKAEEPTTTEDAGEAEEVGALGPDDIPEP